MRNSFEVLPGDPRSTVVMHVPHSSTHVPDDVRADMVVDDDDLAAELEALTDARTDEIAGRAAAAARLRPWLFVNRTSRLVVDPERFPNEDEELNAVGMGAVYVSTCDGDPLREPTEQQRTALLDTYYHPYAKAMAELVAERLDAVARVTIIDVHSYPWEPNAYELHKDGRRPEVCLGTHDQHTPTALRSAATVRMQAAAPTGDVGHDTPFAGCYVPLDQYEQNLAVQAIMLEIRRDVVASRLAELAVATGGLVDDIEDGRRS